MLVEYNVVQLLPPVYLERRRAQWEAEAGKGGVHTSDLTSPPPLGRQILEGQQGVLLQIPDFGLVGLVITWSSLPVGANLLIFERTLFDSNRATKSLGGERLNTLVLREATPIAHTWTAGLVVDIQVASHLLLWGGQGASLLKQKSSRQTLFFDFARYDLVRYLLLR